MLAPSLIYGAGPHPRASRASRDGLTALPRRLRRPRTVSVFRALIVALITIATALAAQSSRPRARDLGIAPGAGTPGRLNAITDVAGVRVGHTTIVEGPTVRTGVTAILPHEGNVFREKV